MKLAFAFFSLLLHSAFSQDPWSIQPGTVELDPTGSTIKVSHVLGDDPINARVILFDKGCKNEIGANQIVSLGSQTYFSPTSTPSISSSPSISSPPSISFSPTWAPKKAHAPGGTTSDGFGKSLAMN